MSGIALHAEGITKRLEEVQALDGLDLEVPAGSIFGLLGPNGAGKTTFIRILLGFLAPDSGRSIVLGEDSLRLSREARRRIGYLSESRFPHGDLPLPFLLRWLGAFFPDLDWRRCEEMARRLDVPQDRPLNGMSAGERRKAELLLALAHGPDLLVLDDPAAGLDITVRRQFLREALEMAQEEGKTVLFTSHILTDVERVADRVAIIDRGKLRLQAPLDDLKARTKRLVLEGAGDGAAGTVRVRGEISREVRGRDLLVVTGEYDPDLEVQLGSVSSSVQVEDLNLDEIFCAVVGRPAAEGSA
jgi:ABC-2 type transport system ATP-binding protein